MLSENGEKTERQKGKKNKQMEIETETNIEREYLETVFNQNNNEKRYTSSDGNYELFYPQVKRTIKI